MLNSQMQPKLQFRHDKFPFTHSFHSQKRPKRRAEVQSTKIHMTMACIYQTPAPFPTVLISRRNDLSLIHNNLLIQSLLSLAILEPLPCRYPCFVCVDLEHPDAAMVTVI